MVRLKYLAVGIPVVVATIAGPQASPQEKPSATITATRDANLSAYVELLRSDLRAQKVAVITQIMEFTEEEDAKFWPVYREYEMEMAKINDDRIALIKDYAMNFDTLTDQAADRLALGALDLEGRRHALKAKYYERFKSGLHPKTAARFLQVENQILLLLDLQIASSLPIASR